MAVSGTINSSLNVRDACYRALRIITAYGANDTPSAEDAQEAMEQLNWMLKSWQADGCNLWREEEATITFPATVREVTLDPRVLDVQEARVQISEDYQRPLARWERGEYITLPNKDTAGSPTIFYFRKLRDEVKMFVWPVPTVDTDVFCTTARVTDDVTDLNQTIDIPQEWNETVYYNLASRLLDIFGIPETRPALAQRITARAEQLYEKLLMFDRPSSVYLKPQYVSRLIQ